MKIPKALVDAQHKAYHSRKTKSTYPTIGELIVRYWHSQGRCPNIGIPDGKIYLNPTQRTRNMIINRIIAGGCNVMIQTIVPSFGKPHQIIWIDNKRFGQS